MHMAKPHTDRRFYIATRQDCLRYKSIWDEVKVYRNTDAYSHLTP